MILKQCILTKNACYTNNIKMDNDKPTGIVIHSTGSNNKALSRYVQPISSDINYQTIINDIGVNRCNNHWNQAYPEGHSVCVHTFIGVNILGKVETYQTLPFNFCCWGIGNGSKDSYNYNPNARIQFEICEDDLTDKVYFNAVFKEAIEFCAYLCKKYGFGIDKISSHAESYAAGYDSNHSDCDYWLKKFDKDMNWFRAEVKKLLDSQINSTPAAIIKPGMLVEISKYAFYCNGKPVPYWISNQKWYVKSVSGDKVIVDKNEEGTTSICSLINIKYLTQSVITPVKTIKVGSTVKIKQGATTYTGGKLASFVYNRNYKVKKIKGDRVTVTFAGIIVAAVKLTDLILVN